MISSAFKTWCLVGVASLGVHLAGLAVIDGRDRTRAKSTSVKVRLVEKPVVVEPTPEPTAAPTPPPPPPPSKPKPTPKPKVKPTPPPAASLPKPKTPSKEEAKPIQGFDKDTMLPADGNSKGISVPVGNTLMVEDKGIRKDDVAPFTGDLSRDAKLVRASVTIPQYTDAAIDANVEGTYVVDVYVDEQGNVVEAELRKKIGYGMDARILTAAKQARFEPRQNRLGKALAGWTEIKFDLRIP